MFCTFILDNVWTLCVVTRASSVTHFLVNFSRDKSSFGCQFPKKSNTQLESQVISYFGNGGRSLKTPLKNLDIMTSLDITEPRIKDNADLQLLSEPYWLPPSNISVRNLSIVGADAS